MSPIGVRLALAATVILSAACIRTARHVLVQDFSRPAERLRAAVQPLTVSVQEQGDPRDVRMTVEVHAPKDSAIVLVLRERVLTKSAVADVLKGQAASIRAEWNRRGQEDTLVPFLTYRSIGDGRSIVIDSLRVEALSRPAGKSLSTVLLNFGGREQRKLDSIRGDPLFLIVRPHEDVRVKTHAFIAPDGFNEDGKYRIHLEWVAVPAGKNTTFRCGAFPPTVIVSTTDPTCANNPPGYPAIRDLDSRTKMVSVNYLYVAGVATVLAILVLAVGRS
jgi:hypothetical protein